MTKIEDSIFAVNDLVEMRPRENKAFRRVETLSSKVETLYLAGLLGTRLLATLDE